MQPRGAHGSSATAPSSLLSSYRDKSGSLPAAAAASASMTGSGHFHHPLPTYDHQSQVIITAEREQNKKLEEKVGSLQEELSEKRSKVDELTEQIKKYQAKLKQHNIPVDIGVVSSGGVSSPKVVPKRSAFSSPKTDTLRETTMTDSCSDADQLESAHKRRGSSRLRAEVSSINNNNNNNNSTFFLCDAEVQAGDGIIFNSTTLVRTLNAVPTSRAIKVSLFTAPTSFIQSVDSHRNCNNNNNNNNGNGNGCSVIPPSPMMLGIVAGNHHHQQQPQPQQHHQHHQQQHLRTAPVTVSGHNVSSSGGSWASSRVQSHQQSASASASDTPQKVPSPAFPVTHSYSASGSSNNGNSNNNDNDGSSSNNHAAAARSNSPPPPPPLVGSPDGKKPGRWADEEIDNPVFSGSNTLDDLGGGGPSTPSESKMHQRDGERRRGVDASAAATGSTSPTSAAASILSGRGRGMRRGGGGNVGAQTL